MKNILNLRKIRCFFIALSPLSLAVPRNSGTATLVTNRKIIQTFTQDSIKQGDYLIQIIAATTGTYGYDIYKGKKLFIHQPTVPAIPGNNGFTTKADAGKVAKLVVEKMKKGESLPTVTVEELKHLDVIPKQ